jgi:hypothetical protein
MDTNSKIELFQALGNSLLFTTSENRMVIRNYLIDNGMLFISGHLLYDGSGNAFVREVYYALEKQRRLEVHFDAIIDIALEIEDNDHIRKKLKAVQENNNRIYS